MSDIKRTIAFLSTYPPRECGIATFTQDLLHSIQKFLGPDVSCKVAALNISPLDTYKYPDEVEWEINQNSEKDYLKFAQIVNDDTDISGVIIQHEYGIFGGTDGEMLLSFMKTCTKPMLVTLHTILPHPNDKMKQVTAEIIKLARSIVVLTNSSKVIVETIYPESHGKTIVIPHGIHEVEFSLPSKFKQNLELDNHIVLSTFGLLSRGKGIEYALQALPIVIKKYPTIKYLILGETHPVIRRREGETYRAELSQLVTELGLEDHVKFYDQYLNLSDLFEFLKATDIYISTSINPNQAVSGTLSYALGSGRTVVSTQFAQAKELVTQDSGRLVPIKNPKAISEALLDLLSDEQRLKDMHTRAYAKTRTMLWSNVAEKYTSLLSATMIPAINLRHLHAMTDDFGLFQFAKMSIPDKDFGYTLDDNARALIVCSWIMKKSFSKDVEDLMTIYLQFIQTCQLPDNAFINYIDYSNKSPTKQNQTEDLEESHSRALWALSEVMSNEVLSQQLKNKAQKLFLQAFKKDISFTHLRSRAYVIKAFVLAQQSLPDLKDRLLQEAQIHADVLVTALSENSHKSWQWFEKNLNYNNALLPESLFIVGNITKNALYTEKAIQSLQFLIKKTFSSDMYLPVGHSHWYSNHKKRSEYDQQPEDPASIILALVSAYENTHNEAYKNLAKKCFSWFLGNNTLGKPLYDDVTGGCHDGLHPDRVNLNQGAESLISYLMSHITLSELD